MAVRITWSETGIRKKIDLTWQKGRALACSQILRDCNLYCKEDSGTLIASSLVHSRLNDGLLIWQTPYAARQYYEIQTAVKDVNPNATWRWVEHAKRLHMKDWVRQADAIMRLYK